MCIIKYGKLPLFFGLVLTSFSCSSSRYTNHGFSEISSSYNKSYISSRQSGDIVSSATILLLMFPYAKDSIQIKDSLAYLYFSARNYDQCIYWSKSSISNNDSNEFTLLLLGNAYKMKGDLLKAIDVYEKLISIKRKPEFIMYLAESQYRVKRLLECVQTTEFADTFQSLYNFSYFYLDSNNLKRSTNVHSALLNIRGLAYYELNNLEKAEQAFLKAIQRDNEFSLAKYNLMIVKEKMRNGLINH